jgi:hypothetical protein
MSDNTPDTSIPQSEKIVKSGSHLTSAKTPSLEIGGTGLNHSSGIVDEDFLKPLVWPKAASTYKEMSRNDPVIGASLTAIEMLIRQADWTPKPADDTEEAKAEAQFLQECMDDMEKSYMEVVNDILSFLPFGFSVQEIVYKRRNGLRNRDLRFRSKFNDDRWGWRKLPTRAQDTIREWDLSEKGELLGLTQQLPNSSKEVYLPRNKFLLFRVNSRKDNPESVSILRNAYRPWSFKKKIEEFEAIGVERDLAGLPMALVPSIYMGEDATTDQKAFLEQVKVIVTSVRNNEQAGLVWPSDRDENGNELFSFKLLGRDGQGSKIYDTEQIIQRYNANIAQTMLADFILLGQKSVGSFALSDNKTELFSVALGSCLDVIADVFNNHAIPQLMTMNGVDPSLWPTLQHGDVETADIEKVGTYFSSLAEQGLIRPDQDLENWLRDQADAPLRTDKSVDVEGVDERIKGKQIQSSETIAQNANQDKPQETQNRQMRSPDE